MSAVLAASKMATMVASSRAGDGICAARAGARKNVAPATRAVAASRALRMWSAPALGIEGTRDRRTLSPFTRFVKRFVDLFEILAGGATLFSSPEGGHMSSSPAGQRFLETTRGQLVTLLRRGPLSVDELARSVGLTDNAVRAHLSTLERDGMVRQSGTRRGTGAGKPATLYELHPDGEAFLSRAYAPVLGALVEELVDQLSPEQSASI